MGQQERATSRILALCALLACAPVSGQEPDRPWNLALRLTASHDTNVPLAATETTFSGNKATNVLALGLTGDYRLHRDGQWVVAATGAVQQTHNGDPALREFDLTSISPGVFARRLVRVAGKPGALSLSYAARRDWLGGSAFASGHSAGADMSLRPTFDTAYGAFASIAYTDFDDEGPAPEFSSRDAITYRAGVRALKGWSGNRRGLQGTLSYVKNDAKGANFVFHGPAAGLQFTSYLVGPWAMALAANYARTEYTNFAVEPRRESRVQDYRLTFFGPLSRKLAADISLGRSKYASNQAAFSAKRENISVGLTYAF